MLDLTLGEARRRLLKAPEPAHHIVQLYEDDPFLVKSVADFLAAGFTAGEPLLVIATESHRQAFTSAVRARGLDFQPSSQPGRVVMLDARATLSTFMVDGMPDAERFRAKIGGLIHATIQASARAPVRAYGEMVDILWKDGNPSAALRLEELWNDLAQHCPFTLLCAYVMGNFCKSTDGRSFEQICGVHSHVLPTERYAESSDSADHLREIALLQQRALALESEIEDRKRLEQSLREALQEQRRVEEALAQSQQELRDFVDNALEGLHWVGPDGIIKWANKAEFDMLGYSRDEYIGHSITEFYVDRDVIDNILKRLLQGEALIGQEARLRAKDGSIRHVLINSNVYWRNGEFIHTRCFTRDITERKRAEAAKDEFLAMLGHELRNPLSPILTALQLMKLRLGDSAAKERALIERQVGHLVRLIDDLMDASRLTRGKLALKPRTLELAEVVARGIELASPLLEERRHRLEIRVPASGLLVEGDEHRLAQVVSNLLMNAGKYTEPGGLVEVEAYQEGKDAVLVVRDSGVGMAPELLSHVFEPFVQGPRSIDRSQGGLGLGLAIVRSLVTLHGGSVSARSDGPGKGSEFTVRLPLSQAFAAETLGQGSQRWPTNARDGRRILVVDDNQDAAEALAELLEARGHLTRHACDGPTALQVAAEFQPEISLMDIGLPGMDGYELAQRIRELPGLSGIKLVAVTGYGQDGDRERARNSGFNAHLVKPADPDLIESTITRLFEPHTLRVVNNR